jgi:hypothetical protein
MVLAFQEEKMNLDPGPKMNGQDDGKKTLPMARSGRSRATTVATIKTRADTQVRPYEDIWFLPFKRR